MTISRRNAERIILRASKIGRSQWPADALARAADAVRADATIAEVQRLLDAIDLPRRLRDDALRAAWQLRPQEDADEPSN